ncbi:MAG: GDSL-type esterase/lipase family protein [Thermodesulfobacteriota bacterium]
MTRQSLVLLGDSLIAFGDWQHHFPGYGIVNLGLAGETVRELRARLDTLDGRLTDPACLVVMVGTNNVAMEEYGFLADYRAIVATLRHRHPTAVLLVNSLLPIRLPRLAPDTVPRLNERLRELAAELGAGYVDGHGAFLASPAAPLLSDDGVHPNDRGYRVWAAAKAALLPPA